MFLLGVEFATQRVMDILERCEIDRRRIADGTDNLINKVLAADARSFRVKISKEFGLSIEEGGSRQASGVR